MIAQYGSEIIDRALESLNVKEIKILTQNDLLDSIKTLTEELKELSCDDPHWKKNISDPDHDGKSTKGSIKEALAAITCKKQGLTDTLIRSTEKGPDFVDENKQFWDIKRAMSKAYTGKDFDSKKFIKSFIHDYQTSKTNIIIDVTELNETDYKQLVLDLKQELNLDKLRKTIIVHRKNFAKSIGNRSWHVK